MAEVFQVVGGALAVVKLTTELASCISNIVSAQQEAELWRLKLTKVGEMHENIVWLLRTRQRKGRHGQPVDLASHLTDRLMGSVNNCKIWLEAMLQQLRLEPGKKGFRRSLAGPFMDRMNVHFVKQQKTHLDMLENDISIALKLLVFVDLEAIDARTRSTDETLRRIMDIAVDLHSSVRSRIAQADISFGSDEEDSETRAATNAEDGMPESSRTATLHSEQADVPDTREGHAALLEPSVNLLMVAIRMERVDEAELLLHSSEDAQSRYYADDEGWNCLHYAARMKSTRMLKLLLDNGLAEREDLLNMMTLQGQTPLMIAAKHAKAKGPETLEMVNLLVESGCKTNAINKAKQNALYFAIEDPPTKESEAIAHFLIQEGADVEPVRERMPDQVRKYRLDTSNEQSTPSVVAENGQQRLSNGGR